MLFSLYNDRMKFPLSKSLFTFLFAACLFAACAKDENANANLSAINSGQSANSERDNANIPKDNAEELARIIKLPFTPEEVIYKPSVKTADNNNGNSAPAGKKLIAVLKFSADDANKIVEQAAKYKPPVPADVDAESWFPAELIAQSQLSGDEVLKGKSYAANDFIQSPYTGGKITRIDNTNFFVLELNS